MQYRSSGPAPQASLCDALAGANAVPRIVASEARFWLEFAALVYSLYNGVLSLPRLACLRVSIYADAQLQNTGVAPTNTRTEPGGRHDRRV